MTCHSEWDYVVDSCMVGVFWADSVSDAGFAVRVSKRHPGYIDGWTWHWIGRSGSTESVILESPDGEVMTMDDVMGK